MSNQDTPTLHRWELGNRLRRLRQDRELTLERVSADLSAEYAGFSPAKISRMETGKRGVNPRDVKDLCEYYGADPAETAALLQLAKDGRGQDWWAGHGSVGDRDSTFIAHEAIARRILNYEAVYVPALLQTREYAQAVVEGMLPDEGAQEVSAFVDVRMLRQARLTGPGRPQLSVVIDESVLHRRVGSAEVVRAQLMHLVDVMGRPNIEVQIVPRTAGVYPGSEASNFVVFEFGDPVSAREEAGYMETLLGSVFIDKSADVKRISRMFYHLQAIALDEVATRSMLLDAAEAI
ncbi:MAG TPA: helix-turn-helix transcriptional regulator [Actinocrinis sp.]|nr:helix-turn-helix transcriptional regulator [Actinocrinis sp.]